MFQMTLERALAAQLARALGSALCVAQLAGCSTSPAGRSFEEHRKYMAERAAAELIDSEETATFAGQLSSARQSHRAGEVERAMRLYFDAFRLDPSDARAHEGIAYLQLSGEPQRAATVFERVIAENPESAMAHAGLGLARLALGEPAAAVAPLERAIELEPDSSSAHYALAVVFDLLERHAEAQVHGRRARELKPHDSGIVNNLGVSYLLSGDTASAEAAFREAVRLEPRDLAYRNNLGLAVGSQQRYEEALKAFRGAGTEQAAENNLGYVYFLNGEYDDAIHHYERALMADGDEKLTVLRNLNAAVDARSAQE